MASIGQSQTRTEAGPYLGQNPTGTTPVVFAPGVISIGNIHSRLEFSPDGQEMFWSTVDLKTFSTQILSVKNVGGQWSSERDRLHTPFVSADESFLLLSSNRPLNGGKEDMFLHVSFRKNDGTWSAPQRVSQIQARFPSLSPDGKYLFFCGDDGNIYWADRKILDPLRPAS